MTKLKRFRFGILFFAIAVPLLSIFNTFPVQADAEDVPNLLINDKLYKQMSTRQHYFWLNYCFSNVDIDEVTLSEVDSWDFFQGNESSAVLGNVWGGGVNAGRACNDEGVVKTAFTYLGYSASDSRKAFCSLKGAEYDGSGDNSRCLAGVAAGTSGGKHWDNKASKSEVAASFQSKVSSKVPSLTPEMEYLRAYTSFMQQCQVKLQGDYVTGFGGGADDDKYQVRTVVQDGERNGKPFYTTKDLKGVGLASNSIVGSGVNASPLFVALAASMGPNSGTMYKVSLGSSFGNIDIGKASVTTCTGAAEIMRNTAGAYAAYLERAGVDKDTKDGLSNEDDEGEKTTCVIDNIGWILCPVLNIMAKTTDAAYSWIASQLTVQPITTTTEGGKAMYDAWSIMRNLANVSFVIVFLFIIYSQITGLGGSNYAIKKLLPKLIVAAILVNVSYWICAVLVDISNIAGTSIKGLFSSVEIESNFGDSVTATGAGGGWEKLTVLLLAGGAAAIAIYLGLSILLPALIAAAFAIVTVFLVLTLRQALITLLIVISPLAFVAFLLPNTEEWFKKWRSLFQTLLLMFPIIAMVFGASALASTIVMTSSTDENSDGKFFLQVTGALIAILPLFITPVVMKTAGGVLNRFGGFINNPNKGPFDRMRKSAEGYRDKRQNIAKSRRLNGTSMFGSPGAKLRKSDSRFARGVGRVIGAPTSVSSSLAGRALTKERQAASAKSSAEFAEQNYVATRAANEASGYAQKIAGPTGSASLAQAYAIEAIEKEKAKDRAAEKTIFEHAGTSFQDLGKGIKGGAYTGARAEAAVQRYFETANSDGVQDMLEHINTVRSDTSLEGDALAHAKEITKVTGDALANSPLRPVDLSATNLGMLRNGEAIATEANRIAYTVAEGKINAGSIGKMDIDEMRRWTSNMVNNNDLLKSASPDKIQATYQAILDAEKDPRINVNFGDREKKGLDDLKKQLQAQLLNTQAKRAEQDSAASTYGPSI